MVTVTRFFYDTEFIEDGHTIDLISIGIVTEDGREYYAVNRDSPWKRIAKRPWLVENVVRSLPRIHGDRRLHVGRRNPLALDFSDPTIRPYDQIANEVESFLLIGGGVPELWADCGAYDHVVLMWLWGDMSCKPEVLPCYTNDIQQEISRSGNPDLPKQDTGAHNALADARHLRTCWQALSRQQTVDRRLP